jgi:glycosyltransferase involved in cell wall biosynthesis
MTHPSLNVVHVTSWISRLGGGIPPVVWAQAREFSRLGLNCSVVGLEDEFVVEDCNRWNLPFLAAKVRGPKSFGYSSELRQLLTDQVARGSVIHSHGLWMYSGIVARNISRETGNPLVVSPHGMLEPWALQNSGWKKRLAASLFENQNLRSADCLHALCEAEATHLRSYGLRNPIAVLPNGVGLEDLFPLPAYEAIEAEHPNLKGKKRLLFLSRIHPKKGLPHLLRAWQRLAREFDDWTLLIAGNDQLGHEQEMRTLTTDLGLENSVLFLGPVYGEAKKRALAGSDAFVLPSFSEGFSMVVLEAAACGLPIVLTPQCNFLELAEASGAIEVEPEVSSCEGGLRRMFSLSGTQRKNMGACGRELIERVYTWPAIAARMGAVYAWLLGQGTKPDCVSLN